MLVYGRPDQPVLMEDSSCIDLKEEEEEENDQLYELIINAHVHVYCTSFPQFIESSSSYH